MIGQRLQRGDYVRVRLREPDEWMDAFVALASDSDPSSVMLIFDGAVRDGRGGLIAKTLPLTINYDGQMITSLFGDTYQLEVAS